MSGRWVRPTRRTCIACALGVGVSLATAGYLAYVYPTLPFGLPVQYARGRPLIYDVKSPVIVFLPVIIQATLLTIFSALVALLLWRAQAVEASAVADENARRMRTAAEAVALLGALWISVQATGAARLIVLWQGGMSGFGRIYNAVLLSAIVLSILIVARTMRALRRQEGPAVVDDPRLWWLRHLYVNPRDPALFVPSRSGNGWTLNFGRPLAILILAITLGLGIGGPLYVARMILRGFWG